MNTLLNSTIIIAQKRAIRAIINSQRYAHTLPLLNENRLLRFDLIHEYFVCLVLFKYINFSYTNDAFSRVNHRQGTRG